tara:strand:- start:1247 stop:2269 length:1023 start_codon:yes stop_codon:yes gene_type:complete
MTETIHKQVPIADIKFDVSNPRIKFINPFDHADDEQMQNQAIPSLLRDPAEISKNSYSYGTLKSSIIAAGTIVNPIWLKVVDDHYICIEGNTRLCIYRELLSNAEGEEREKWEKIPAIVYENMSAEDEHKLKLTAHVVGTRNWSPYSRAKYVNELLEGTFSWDQIVDIVGGRKVELANSAQAQHDFDEFYYKKYDELDEKKFSYFVEASTRKSYDVLDDHGFSKQDFADWVHEGKLKRAYNVRYLKDIMANPDAKAALISGDINDSMPFIIGEPEVNISGVSTSALLTEIIKRIDDLSEDESFYEDEELIAKIVLLSSSVRDALVNMPEEELDKHFGNKS